MKAAVRSYRVLVVDDDAVLRETVGRYMRRSGYLVVTVQDAEAALKQAQAEPIPFDVVITDVHMPNMDGIELLTRLRARWPSQCVVIVTGHIDEKLARTALANGAANYLLKPFGLGELEAAVSKAITTSPSTSIEQVQ